MDKKLIKQLKDAGFKWKDFRCSWCIEGGHNSCSVCDDEYIPTLLELIEACGDSLWSMTKHGDVWQTNFKEGMAGETASKDLIVAVANLYIRIKKVE